MRIFYVERFLDPITNTLIRIMGEYHPCGSVAMGDALDSKLNVKGVQGLRVADASVFPNHVSGNIVSSVYAVAEKAADIIKADWAHVGAKKLAA